MREIQEVTMINMVLRLFEDKQSYDNSIKRWAQIEYGRDWVWAYNFILNEGKPPVKGVNY